MSEQKTELDIEQIQQALGWQVVPTAIQLADGTPVASHVANTRMLGDERFVLGVVGKGYQVIQNDEILELADAVRNQHGLKFSHAGVVGNGQRVYFQCAGDSFQVGDGDAVTPYMLFVNAHDGTLACRMTPMTERMVCQNQLGNMIKTQNSWVSIRHSGDVSSKLAEAGRLGQHFMTVAKANRQAMLRLRGKTVSTKKMAQFFKGLYENQIGFVAPNPKDKAEEHSLKRADRAFAKYKERFELEKPIAGATAWNMANAYTGWLQHDHRTGKDPQRSQQRRRQSALFGVNAQRSVQAFQAALNA